MNAKTRLGGLVGGLGRALAAMLVCAMAGLAGADVVRMKDGRVFEGQIKKTTTMRVVIDTIVAGIRTTLTLDRTRIEAIERKALPEGFFGDEAQEREESPRARAPSERDLREAPGRQTRYVEVPMEGVFGEDIQPEGVRDALARASRVGAEHIVFTLKSPGGLVAAADEIAEILAEHDGEFTYHALVEEGYSASVWVIFSCDNVFMKPGGAFGAAVAYTKDNSTGAIEVDAKFNSALAGEVAGIAERKGHNADLARAMVLMDASLYEWRDASGESRVGARSPEDVASVKQLDTPETVLTLTAQDALRLGVARAMVEAAEDIGGMLGLDGWRERGRVGALAMAQAKARATREAQRREREIDSTQKAVAATMSAIQALRQEAVSEDPERFTYYFNINSGLMTAESQRKWTEQADKAIRIWTDVQAGLVKLESLLRDAERLGLDLERDALAFAMPVEKEADTRLRWLRANRVKLYR